MTDEEVTQMAPGLIKAFAPQEEENDGGRRRRTSADESISALRSWSPKTRLGREVMAGRIVTYEAAIASGLPMIPFPAFSKIFEALLYELIAFIPTSLFLYLFIKIVFV